MEDNIGEFLVNLYKTSLEKKYNDTTQKIRTDYERSLLATKNSFESSIECTSKRIQETLFSLENWYRCYCDDETNNTISIKGVYYDQLNPEYTNNRDCDKYMDRTIESWSKFNNCEKEVIDLFIRKLPINIRIAMKLSDFKATSRNKSYSLTHKYEGGESLIITATKL